MLCGLLESLYQELFLHFRSRLLFQGTALMSPNSPLLVDIRWPPMLRCFLGSCHECFIHIRFLTCVSTSLESVLGNDVRPPTNSHANPSRLNIDENTEAQEAKCSMQVDTGCEPVMFIYTVWVLRR